MSRYVEPGYESYTADRWQVTGLKLKHTGNSVVRNHQKKRLYKFVDGTVTWTHEGSVPCQNFTETFSLKDVKLESESSVRFFAPLRGRNKHQWRMNGDLYVLHTRTITCPGYEPFELGMPSFVSGTKVGQKSPIARPGKKVRLVNNSYRKIGNEGSYDESRSTLTLRPRRAG